MGDQPNPQIVAVVKDRYWSMAFETLKTWSDPEGRRLINPRTIVSIDPDTIFLDQLCDVAEGPAALEWFTASFNETQYHAMVQAGIDRAAAQWARAKSGKDYDEFHLRITTMMIEQLDRRPAE
jgi:hypothetical protein